MTDFELNKAIAEALGYESRLRKSIDYKGGAFHRLEFLINDRWILTPDYCNNWNDLMPLVVEYDISFSPPYVVGGNFAACQWKRDETDFFAETLNKNPQRALAECLLKVLEEK